MERADIHPSRDELSGYWKDTLEFADRDRISLHIKECEFCSEIIRDLEELDQIEREMAIVNPSLRSETAAQMLYRNLCSGQTFELDSRDQIQPAEYMLAADGKQTERPAVENLATVFSSDPEIVLKIMRDNRFNRTYLHLISDNPALYSHVLVESPGTNQTYMTNEAGQAEIENSDSFDAATAKWQVKLPSAEFSLEPLGIEPERIEYQKETILQTDRGDRVRLTLEGKADSKQIKVEVLSLEGYEPGGPLVATMSLGGAMNTQQAAGGKPMFFQVDQLPTSIQLRLYK
jgi:hypothetical protein